MKRVTTTYIFIVFGLIAFHLLFHFFRSIREKTIYNIFSFNKFTQKIDAKVIGYSYNSHKSQKSSTTFSYSYGLEYLANNQKYFGRYKVVENEDWRYKEYVPLPKSISIVVNKNDPRQFVYLETHYGKGFMFYLGHFIYLALGLLYLFATDDKELKTSNVLEESKTKNSRFKKLENLATSGMVAIFILFPLIKAIYTIVVFNRGEFSENIEKAELVHKKPTNLLKSNPLNSSAIADELNIYKDYLDKDYTLVTIAGFRDTTIQKCYTMKGDEKIDLRFNYTDNHLTVYQPRGLARTCYNLYLISGIKKYLIPLDMVQYDFQYK